MEAYIKHRKLKILFKIIKYIATLQAKRKTVILKGVQTTAYTTPKMC